MRVLYIILFSLLCITQLLGQTTGNGLHISHLTGDVYVYTTYNKYKGNLYPSNSLYIVTGKGVVLIDTPWDSTQFQPLLDSIARRHNKEVVLCIPTHYHADRTAGLEFFRQKGIKTYSTQLTYDLCKKHGEKQAQYYFRRDTLFTVGEHTIATYYPGEGHTQDNIVVWFEKEKVLFGGCLVKSTETDELGNTADANLGEWANTIRNVMKKYPKAAYIIPGHLGWRDKRSLMHTIKLLKEHTAK